MELKKIAISIFRKEIKLMGVVGTILLYSSCVSLKTPQRTDLLPLQAPMLIGKYPVVMNRSVNSTYHKDTVIKEVIWYYFKDSSAGDEPEWMETTHIE